METIKGEDAERQPEAQLHTSGVDTALIQALSKYWVVVVEAEQQGSELEIVYTLYTKE